jgi:hypothetical protein
MQAGEEGPLVENAKDRGVVPGRRRLEAQPPEAVVEDRGRREGLHVGQGTAWLGTADELSQRGDEKTPEPQTYRPDRIGVSVERRDRLIVQMNDADPVPGPEPRAVGELERPPPPAKLQPNGRADLGTWAIEAMPEPVEPVVERDRPSVPGALVTSTLHPADSMRNSPQSGGP